MVELEQKRVLVLSMGIAVIKREDVRDGAKEGYQRGTVQEIRNQGSGGHLGHQPALAYASAWSGSMKSYRKVEQERNQETFRVGDLKATSKFKRATYMRHRTRNDFVIG